MLKLRMVALLAGWMLSQAALAADAELIWVPAEALTIEGRGWTDTKSLFDRLPAKAEGVVRPPVWSLSRNSAGICVRFMCDSTKISCRWKLTSKSLGMTHMPPTGVSGVDLYARDGDRWRWVSCARPDKFPENEFVLADGLPEEEREYCLYLPLYNGVESVEIGHDSTSLLYGIEKSTKKPIVFYGTSIVNGASASRPGMTHSAILGRRLNWPIINLGFSGNAKMEPEVASLLAELDPAVYVIDALPNMNAMEVRERAGPLMRTIRAAHPLTPIVLVEDRNYADAWWNAARRQRNETNQAALKEVFQKLQKDGVQGLHYITADVLLGADGDDTVDGSHPTDLGFSRMADAMEPVLRPLLK